MSNLQRMIVIHPELFKKFKHIITEDQNLTELDKKMKSILHNKNLNDINKWYQYRESLFKFSFLKNNKLTKKMHTQDNSTQTDRLLDTNTYSPIFNDKMEVPSDTNGNNNGGEDDGSADNFDDDDDKIRQITMIDQPIEEQNLNENSEALPIVNTIRLTRARAAAAKIISKSPKKLVQSASPLKVVKKPNENKNNSPTSSPSTTQKKSIFSWTPY